MVGSLCLLLLALGIVLWHDRDFWFPDAPDEAEQSADGSSVESAPLARSSAVQNPDAVAQSERSEKSRHAAPTRTAKRAVAPRSSSAQASSAQASSTQASSIQASAAQASETRLPAIQSAEIPSQATATSQPATSPVAVMSRTVLPPLDVEVVAGNTHRTLRPGGSSVRVDLQPGMPAQTITEADPSGEPGSAAKVTSSAAERVQMSADASEIVSRPVRPNYPMLARQMKVQGSVILQALIGRDGIIQNLHVVSGPHILASAAEDAVRQWHFKPHFQGSEPVETEAKITVNFTISTN